ncbi:PA14 domain-containing protein [Massilia sp. TWP1-3-3]|uniref:PA14 domain-containing protein n=1 Tax=Massilia sp. TWP1-3-3 TaxID=2804573 RepID=UPI003CF540FB
MSDELNRADSFADTLADCDCCKGVHSVTPADQANPPGQSALKMRVGTHARFLQSQVAALAGQDALHGLTTRAPDDPALALLDGWSALLDVLSFYQERIANEGYLRSATERRSVLELARTIGYELRPGVAASTYLAFGMESAPGAPAGMRIPLGLKTQSTPGQDETAQVFETLEAIDARARWNALAVAHEDSVTPVVGTDTLYLRGQHTGLQAGDLLLVVGDERLADPADLHWDVRQVTRVLAVAPLEASADPLAGHSVVTLERALGSSAPPGAPVATNARCYALRAKAALFGANAPDWRAMPATLRAAYLGFDKPEQAPIGEHGQWPGFTMAGVSDAPPGELAGSGLYAEYFAGKQLNVPACARLDPVIDFHWGAGGPDARVGVDHFAARWSGWLEVPATGDYTLFVLVDDGVRLWLDGKLLIDQWVDHGSTEFGVLAAGLERGKKYDLRLEYYENGGGATIVFSWQGPGLAKQVVPAERLYPRDVNSVHLDASYTKWVAGSWMVLGLGQRRELYQVVTASDDGRSQFTLTSKTTRLLLRGARLRELFNDQLRATAAYGESSELAWAARPRSGLLAGLVLDLTTQEDELAAGRMIALAGKVLREGAGNAALKARLQNHDPLAAFEPARDGKSARFTFIDGQRLTALLEPASEVVRIQHAEVVDGHTRLLLETALVHAYLPATLRVNANVAAASHGDSRQMQIQPELLGGGDSSRTFQRFALRQAPLTHIAAATASGAASTLALRVDGVLWQAAPRIGLLGPRTRGYVLQLNDDGQSVVQFGDGVHGARLPSGELNVEASYRVGLGSQGNLASGKIDLLLMRPLGLKEVVNPVPASGGADPESGARARANAPLTVRTLDRIVSLRDVQDFAAAFAGIGKAQAVWLWNGAQRLVHLTVGGVDGADIDPLSALHRNLAAAVDAARAPHQMLTIAPGRTLWFGLDARVAVLAGQRAAPVLARVRLALQAAFGFAARSYGQSLSGSELLAAMQAVEGVDWIDLDQMRLRATPGGPVQAQVPGPDGRLRSQRAHWQDGQVAPAELLLPDLADVNLSEVTA